MNDQAHRGARPGGPTTQPADRRVLELDEAVRVLETTSGRSNLGYAKDSTRSAQAAVHALTSSGQIVRGMIVHALPHFHWYKVQIGGIGWHPCCSVVGTGLLPLGPREYGVIPPGSSVLVHLPDRLGHGVIIGVIPPALADGNISLPDWIFQGGGSGFRREAAHKYPLQGTVMGGGVIDWSGFRPEDETAFDKGWITPTGLRIGMDDFQIQVAANEFCGLFVNYLDSHVRLAGVQLDIESLVHGEHYRDDEGESRYMRGVATYPWEALGAYNSGLDFTRENDDYSVQYTSNEGKVEVKVADLQPFYRYVEYGGYLGHVRAMVAPINPFGMRRYVDPEADPGLFRESIGADGTYQLLSAKTLHIGKRCKIIVPKETRPVEDGLGDDAGASLGDNAEAGSYKFSGTFGTGPAHTVGDFGADVATPMCVQRAAAVQDSICYIANWKVLHAFHHHTRDFATPQESEARPFNRNQEHLDFSALQSRSFLPDPEPVKLKIDTRYGEVSFFERESFLIFHDDGTVQIGGGCGEQIVLGGGQIRLDAPGAVVINPGCEFLCLAGDVIIRSKGSLDLSTSDGDVRIKAEKNMQLLAGNSGQGGMLIESRGEGTTHQYAGKFGEDVSGSGVVLRAADSQVAVLGKDLYFRTGGEELGDGDILFDAGKGTRRVQIYAEDINLYTTNTVTIGFGPVDETSTIDKVYLFGQKSCIVDTKLFVGEKIVGYGDKSGIVVEGKIFASGAIASGGKMSDKKGGQLGATGDEFKSRIEEATAEVDGKIDEAVQKLTTAHEQLIVEKYYTADKIGNDDTIKFARFSFRDPPVGDQYHVAGLKWSESRWQMMARLGGGSGGTPWEEKPVVVQGEETYPWPGKRKWQEEPVFLRLETLGMYDPATGNARDRPGPYEDPQTSNLTPVTMASGCTMIR